MAIQLQLQQRNFGRPLDSAAEFHRHLQLGNGQSSPLLSQECWSKSDSRIDNFVPEMSVDQIDRFIRLESERFRLLLQHKINQQIRVLLNQIENRTRVLFQQKDEEIASTNMRTIQLEQLLKKLEMENQMRKRAVEENQAMVASLSQALDEMREKLLASANDAESSNNNVRIGEDDASDFGNNKKRKKMMLICQICNSRISCVLLLPCRHLCSCKSCASALEFCPVCNATKKASIEAVIS